MKKLKKLFYQISALLSIAIILLSSILYLLETAYFNPFLSNRLNQPLAPFPSTKIHYAWTSNQNPPRRTKSNSMRTNNRNLTRKVNQNPTFPIKPLQNHINLNYKYIPSSKWINKRSYSGLWINNYNFTDTEYNLTNAFLSQAKYPNLPFYEKEEFNSFQELLNFLNPTYKESLTNFINNYCPSYIEILKQLILKFYNYIADTWGKNNVNAILNRIDIMEYLNADGYAFHNYTIQIRAETLTCHYNKDDNWSFSNGLFSVLSPFRVLFHELGHMLDFFLKKVNINISESLKKFLASKIINLNKWSSLDKNRIFQLFHLSEYSFSSLYEVIAEGFVYWFMIPKEFKTKAWEFWHEFLTLYLPKSTNWKVKR